MRFTRRGLREDPFSERQAFAFKVACADPWLKPQSAV